MQSYQITDYTKYYHLASGEHIVEEYLLYFLLKSKLFFKTDNGQFYALKNDKHRYTLDSIPE